MAGRRYNLKTVFLDSSVLFTAVNSPTGGSAKLFTLKHIRLKTSQVVLTEVERNIRKKLQSYHLDRFFLLVQRVNIVEQVPSARLVKQTEKVIDKKDAVILAEARKVKANFLVTLDKKHFLTEDVAKFLKPQQVLTPKMLLEIVKEY